MGSTGGVAGLSGGSQWCVCVCVCVCMHVCAILSVCATMCVFVPVTSVSVCVPHVMHGSVTV